MGWIIYAALSGFSSSLFNYINRIILKVNQDSTSFSWWFEFIRTFLFLFILPFDNFIIWSYKTVFLLGLIGLIEFFSVYFYMRMHVASELSISTIVLRLRIVFVPIFAFIIFGEKLMYLEYFGILIIFVGLSFVTSPRKFFIDKGIRLALLCSLITALLSVVIKIASPFASASLISIAMGIPSLLLFPLIARNWKFRIKDFYNKNIKEALFATIFNSLAMYLQISAFKIGPAGKVVAIFQAMSIISVFMGIFLLNERKDVWKKIIGSLVVLIGVLLLI